jgi:hypothetical protein
VVSGLQGPRGPRVGAGTCGDACLGPATRYPRRVPAPAFVSWRRFQEGGRNGAEAGRSGQELPLGPDYFDPGQGVFENPHRTLRLWASFGLGGRPPGPEGGCSSGRSMSKILVRVPGTRTRPPFLEKVPGTVVENAWAERLF